MWIDLSKYARGFLRWDKSLVRAMKRKDLGIAKPIKELKVTEQKYAYCYIDDIVNPQDAFEIELLSDNGTAQFPVASFEWLDAEANIEAQIWLASNGTITPGRLKHAFAMGDSYRLVVSTPKLDWQADRMYRADNHSIRFINGTVHGHRSATTGYERKDGYVEANGTLGPASETGRFIEIIASASSEIDSKTKCYAIYGWLCLVLGPSAVGVPAFETTLSASGDGAFSEMVLNQVRWDYSLNLPDEAFSKGLARTRNVVASQDKAAMRALERYYQGIATSSEELRLSAFFSGIEVIVRGFEKQRGGVPEVNSRVEEFGERVATLLDTLNNKSVAERLMNSLRHTSTLVSFNFYASQAGLSADDIKVFKNLFESRNKLYHSGSARNLIELGEMAKKLLWKLLAKELRLDSTSFWDRFDPLDMNFPITYPNHGLNKCGDSGVPASASETVEGLSVPSLDVPRATHAIGLSKSKGTD